ncbi:MAG TPA: secretin N-terminal domain-containing protein [Gemmatimonadales bacterium]|nr:secretin N-terminal domain-containing protein [Gemmatimonadales bacterium]
MDRALEDDMAVSLCVWRQLLAAGSLAVGLLLVHPSVGRAQDSPAPPVRTSREGVSVRFVDADLRTVIQALGPYLPKPIVTTNIPGARVSLQTPEPVDRETLLTLLQGLVDAQGLDFDEDSLYIRIGQKPPPPAPVVAPDATRAAGTIELFVIRLKHARAADVAATVNLLFGGGGTFSGRSGLSSGTLSEELRQNAIPPVGAPVPPGGGQGATLSGPSVVVPDELTNSLLVRASAADFEVLKRAVEQLDIRPLQVLIEVMIVEARRDRQFSLSTDLFAPLQEPATPQPRSGVVTSTSLGDVAVQVMNVSKYAIDATLHLAESKGDVQIISRPVLLAMNNHEATILVGSQRPFIQVSRALPTDNAARDQVVQYRDVGTRLTVRPTINQDGYVSLLIQQEINNATSEVQFDAPVISTRETSTQVLVKDKQTIVLGGLRDQQKDRVRAGVPILSGIPLIGGLFGTTNRRSSQTELYLFLTPRIIRDDAEADSLTTERLPKGVEP